MPKKALETLSEPMFYVLMALKGQNLCGADIVAWVNTRTQGRVTLGPGTLYTILPKLTESGMLHEVATEGRRRTYEITEQGRALYEAECARLRRQVADMEAAERERIPFRKEA